MTLGTEFSASCWVSETSTSKEYVTQELLQIISSSCLELLLGKKKKKKKKNHQKTSYTLMVQEINNQVQGEESEGHLKINNPLWANLFTSFSKLPIEPGPSLV